METEKSNVCYVRSILKRIGMCKLENIEENLEIDTSLDKALCLCINLSKVLDDSEPTEQAVLDTIESDIKELEWYAEDPEEFAKPFNE